MRVWRSIQWHTGAAIVALALPATAAAQVANAPAAPPAQVFSMEDAVRMALERNQTLRATRLTLDESRADEITAALKPNLNASFGADGFPLFSPSTLTFSTLGSVVNYGVGLGYTFERGGKRQRRISAARDTTDMTAQTVLDAERQLRFQTEQAFINVLLAKATLDVAQQDLKSFSDEVDINRQRVSAGDLSGGDFLKISIQKLQFETDVSTAELSLIQAKAALRQLVGYESAPADFDVRGDLVYTPRTVSLDDLTRTALASRPDLLAAQGGVRVAEDNAALERSNRARDVDGSLDYTRNGFGPVSTLGVGVAFDLPIHDRNQGNIAHADVAVRQANETEAATRAAVLTDVATAFAQYQTNEKVVQLYESGYLDQARQSLDITTFAFQRGAATLLDLLDAERTSRTVQIAYRQALAAYLTGVRQLNLVVGKQVVP
jgi:cobalt-zinc-cadmium efflux system outer membrane protein